MTEPVMRPHADFSNEELLDEWALLRTRYNELYKEMGIIKMVLSQRMKANRARKIPHPYVVVEMGPPTAIVDRLIGLREVVGQKEFSRAFTPAHTEEKTVEVGDKINLTVVNGWATQGDHIREIIDHGTDHETATLSLKLKQERYDDEQD
jgi:hypothetical protein